MPPYRVKNIRPAFPQQVRVNGTGPYRCGCTSRRYAPCPRLGCRGFPGCGVSAVGGWPPVRGFPLGRAGRALPGRGWPVFGRRAFARTGTLFGGRLVLGGRRAGRGGLRPGGPRWSCPVQSAFQLLQPGQQRLLAGARAGQTGLLDAPADRLEKMAGQAGRFGQAELARSAEIISEGLIQMRGTTSPRLLLELMCAQILPVSYTHLTLPTN